MRTLLVYTYICIEQFNRLVIANKTKAFFFVAEHSCTFSIDVFSPKGRLKVAWQSHTGHVAACTRSFIFAALVRGRLAVAIFNLLAMCDSVRKPAKSRFLKLQCSHLS